MTPKEKARDLWANFLGCLIRTSNTYVDNGFIEEQAKQCALILTKEMIEETRTKYWYDVKQEIEKL